jgi:hypothetical protein
VAVNSIYVSTILSYKYNLVLKSFSYGTQVMGHPVCDRYNKAAVNYLVEETKMNRRKNSLDHDYSFFIGDNEVLTFLIF